MMNRDLLEYMRVLGFDAVPPTQEPPAVLQSQTDPHRDLTKEFSLPLSLSQLRENLKNCELCKLCKGRTQVVFGTGDEKSSLMFVGEGPGAEEDRQGVPFVGRAGELLTKMIQAMGYTRDSVYIANVVKCRPPENRNPEPDEVQSCAPFLKTQIEMVKPKVIVALGTFAAQTLLGTEVGISKLRGQWGQLAITSSVHVQVMPTFHPAYLLRNPDMKKVVWEDLQTVMRRLANA